MASSQRQVLYVLKEGIEDSIKDALEGGKQHLSAHLASSSKLLIHHFLFEAMYADSALE